jgi:hypothetical protein
MESSVQAPNSDKTIKAQQTTLVDSSAHAYPIQCRCPTAPEEERPVPGREGPAAGEPRRRGDRHAPSTWEAVRLREANWYPTRNVGASEAIQISANRPKIVCQWIDHMIAIMIGPLAAMNACTDAPMACGCLVPMLADGITRRKDAVVDRASRIGRARSRSDFGTNRASSPMFSLLLYFNNHYIPSSKSVDADFEARGGQPDSPKVGVVTL